MELTILCDRCKEYFKPLTRFRFMKIGSTHIERRDSRILKTVYLCPTCAENFNKWLKYQPKKKGESL